MEKLLSSKKNKEGEQMNCIHWKNQGRNYELRNIEETKILEDKRQLERFKKEVIR